MAAERTATEWMVLPVRKYAQFSGRAPRAEYWWFYLGTTIIAIVCEIIDRAIGSEIGILGTTTSLVLFIPSIAVTVRRLHDTERTGWWFLAAIIPAVIFGIQVSLAAGSVDDWTPSPASLISIFAFAAACLTIFVFTVLRGTEGPNRYGPDPYGPQDQLAEIFA